MKNELTEKGLHTHSGVWSRTKIILSFNCAYYVLDNLLNVNQILAIPQYPFAATIPKVLIPQPTTALINLYNIICR